MFEVVVWSRTNWSWRRYAFIQIYANESRRSLMYTLYMPAVSTLLLWQTWRYLKSFVLRLCAVWNKTWISLRLLMLWVSFYRVWFLFVTSTFLMFVSSTISLQHCMRRHQPCNAVPAVTLRSHFSREVTAVHALEAITWRSGLFSVGQKVKLYSQMNQNIIIRQCRNYNTDFDVLVFYASS